MGFIFDPSLVLYLPLYELDGSSFMSRDAYGHLGTVTGALWQPNGRYFDGLDDQVGVPAHTAINALADFTFEAWAKWATTDKSFLFNDDDDGVKLQIWRIGTKLRCYLHATAHDSTSDVSLGVWLHIVIVRKGAGLFQYVNGSVFESFSSVSSTALPSQGYLIGKWRGGTIYTMDGPIGEVRIYNRALSPIEIQHNYLATKWRYQ